MKEAIIYLLAITAAEVVTVIVHPLWGIVCHVVILATVLLHSAIGLTNYHHRQLVLSLALVPLVRIISLRGVAEYFILLPQPMVSEFTWQAIWLPALILLICIGFGEEFIFRGVLQ